MKKYFLIALIIAASVVCIAAVDFQPSERSFQFQMNGTWLPNVHPLHVGANNYTTLQNLRPTETGYETVEGYSKINTTLTSTPSNVHHFSKNDESHVVAKIVSSGGTFLYDNTTAIPSAGDFDSSSLYEVTGGAGSFVNGPSGTMFYADGTHNLVWGGDEFDVGAFLQGDDTDDVRDFTARLNSDLTSEFAVVGDAGNDSYTVLLLHMDGTDGSTTFTDSSASGHSPSAVSDAQIDTDFYKFGGASGVLDGTNDYVTVADSADWNFGSGDYTIDTWVMFNSEGTHGICGQYVDANNYFLLSADNTSPFNAVLLSLVSGGATQYGFSVGIGDIFGTNEWHHIAVSRNGSSFRFFVDGTLYSTGTDSSAHVDLAAPLTIGNANSTSFFDGWIDELRISKGIARFPSAFTPQTFAYSTNNGAYFYLCSQFKLNGFKAYISTINTTASTMVGAVWTGSAFSTLSLTDGTASGGVTLAQNGSVTWSYSEDPKPMYINGGVFYVYRFAPSAGSAVLYKTTVSAPLQPIRDVWNQAPRTSISFQALRSGGYEDYTFHVESKDSTTDTPYAATIGSLAASDSVIVFFDDRSMGANFTMLSSLVNTSDAQVYQVNYWDGVTYSSVGFFSDETLDTAGDSSFANSGAIWWNPPDESLEHPQEAFGIKGYGYQLLLDGTLTPGTDNNGTSIDLVTGITAPIEMTGYDRVGSYNGRVMLIDGNRMDYSQTYFPWVFNGVDSSDDERLSLFFGDDNDIVATTNLFNRYGSNLIETMVVFKKNALSILTGSQPYPQFSDPFVIKDVSHNIGCAAPLTVNSYQMEVGDGLRMSIVVWLDFSGPYYYNGAEPSRIEGVENFFDLSETTYINYSYIDTSIAYIDSVNDQWNLLIPVGSSTTPNKWLVYDFRHKKWFEKVPSTYPTLATHVVDTDGARYNYGFLSTGQMLRLDNTQAWDGSAISQSITTGYFSPPVQEGDQFGFWTRSKLRAIRLLSGPISEDQDVTVTVYNDGSASSNALTVALDSSGVISKNNIRSGNLNEEADYYQVNFAASSSSEKWTPLAWGYKAVQLRED